MSQYEIWSLVIGVLVFGAAGATARIYFLQLQSMQKQLTISLEASVRMAHLDLLKIALSDDDILSVWQSEIDPQDKSRARQHMFVSLHLSHLETLYRLERITDAQVLKNLEIRKDNQAYKQFWAVAAKYRRDSLDPKDNYGNVFHNQCVQVFGQVS